MSMVKYFVSADVSRTPTAKEAREIGVPGAAIHAGRVKTIVMANDPKDAIEKGRKIIEGCMGANETALSFGCMEYDWAKKLGDLPIYMAYGTATKIMAYRRAAGMTRQQLSDASGVSVGQLAKIESGAIELGNLTTKNYLAICKALAADPYDLYT